MPTKTPPDRMLTDAEAAEMLGIKPGTLPVWRATKRYPLPYVRIGRCVRYRMSDVEKFIEKNTVKA